MAPLPAVASTLQIMKTVTCEHIRGDCLRKKQRTVRDIKRIDRIQLIKHGRTNIHAAVLWANQTNTSRPAHRPTHRKPITYRPTQQFTVYCTHKKTKNAQYAYILQSVCALVIPCVLSNEIPVIWTLHNTTIRNVAACSVEMRCAPVIMRIPTQRRYTHTSVAPTSPTFNSVHVWTCPVQCLNNEVHGIKVVWCNFISIETHVRHSAWLWNHARRRRHWYILLILWRMTQLCSCHHCRIPNIAAL